MSWNARRSLREPPGRRAEAMDALVIAPQGLPLGRLDSQQCRLQRCQEGVARRFTRLDPRECQGRQRMRAATSFRTEVPDPRGPRLVPGTT